MYRTTLKFHDRIERGEKPVAYCVITTDLGRRAYGEKWLTNSFEDFGRLANGSSLADGTYTAGIDTKGFLDIGGRVKSFSPFERTVAPRKKSVLASYASKQLQHVSVKLDNADDYFTRIIAREPFLTKPVAVYIGFEADPFEEHMQIFEGAISVLSVTGTEMQVEADERG